MFLFAAPPAIPPAAPDFSVYQLQLDRDLPIASGTVLLFTIYLALDKQPRPDPCALGGSGCNASDINAFDHVAVEQHSHAADVASDYTRLAAVVSPLVIDFLMMRDPYGNRANGFMNDIFLESEVVGLAAVVTALIEIGTDRLRPYAYSDTGRPEGSLRDANDFTALPSGHTSMAFSAASFGCYTYVRRARPTFGKAMLWCTPGLALAAATGILRVEAGRHFPTDVLAGAALGIGIGIGVPMVHRDPGAWSPTVFAVPGGAAVGLHGLF